MARGRMVNTTIALDPEFNALSVEAQLLFLRTIPHLDRDGLIIGLPPVLWATVAPLMPGLMAGTADAIDEWIDAGFVQRFDTKIGPVLWFRKFKRNQSNLQYDREPPSKLPIPDGYERTKNGIQHITSNLLAESTQSTSKALVKSAAEVEVEVEVEVKQSAAAAADSHAPARTHEVAAAAAVLTMWTENKMGELTPHLADQLAKLCGQYDDREIVHAIGIACDRNQRNLGYVRGILKRGAFSDTSPPARNGDAASDAAATRAKLDRDRQRTDEYLARLNPRQRTIIDGH